MGFHKKNIQFAGSATVGPKGQVVIPVEAREKMGIKPGDKMIAVYMSEQKAIGFLSEEAIDEMLNKMDRSREWLRSILERR